MAKSWKIHFNWLQFLLIILLALGIFFRFVNLDRKVYWVDETVTSLRISGYSFAEVGKLISNGIISAEDLQRYQRTNPDKNVINTIQGLAVEEPQHPPLYYVMARIWVQWFGNSVVVTRSLSALFSLLVFPCLYWLCLELFERPLVGWVAIALIAVSPFHVLYAQEARQYSLWTATILLSSAALLRAMRLKSKLSWGIYAATLALSFYTFLLSGLVAIGHGIYVLITENFRLRKTFNAYLLSTFAGFIVFMPWVFVVITNLFSAINTLAWTLSYKPKPVLIQMWVLNISRIFADFHYSFSYKIVWLYAVIVILIGYSIYFLCRHTPKKVWLFVLTLIGSTAGILSIADLITNGRMSTVTRYLIPSFLGIHLAVAYFLATQIYFVSAKNNQIIFWRSSIVLLTLTGVLSCAFISQQTWWWNKYWTRFVHDIAPIVNQAKKPLFITNNYSDIGTFSYLFYPKVQVQVVDNKDFVMPNGNIRCPPSIFGKYNNFGDIFLLVSKLSIGQEDISETNTLQSELEKKDNCEMELVRKWDQEIEPGYSVKTSLWKLKK